MPNNDPAMTGIWGELNKVLGGLDLNNDSNGYENGHGTSKNNGHGSSSALNGGNNGFLSIGSRSSLDLGTLGRSEQQNGSGPGLSSTSPSSSSSMINTANMGRQLSLPTETSNPSNSLPAFGGLNGVASNAEAGTSTPPSDLTKDEQSTTSEAVAWIGIFSPQKTILIWSGRSFFCFPLLFPLDFLTFFTTTFTTSQVTTTLTILNTYYWYY